MFDVTKWLNTARLCRYFRVTLKTWVFVPVSHGVLGMALKCCYDDGKAYFHGSKVVHVSYYDHGEDT